MIDSMLKTVRKFASSGVYYGRNGEKLDYARFPRWVHIENTNACPARCTMCPMDIMTRKTGVMNMDLYEKLIREVAAHPEVQQLHLHGFGEPLVDKQLPAKVARAKELGIPYTYIVTTASLLTPQVAEDLIRAGLDGIKFSFYGMTKPTYESIHGRLDFEAGVRNIEEFFNLRDRLRAPNPEVRFQFSKGMAPPEEFDMFIEHWRPYMDADRNDVFQSTGLHNWAGARNYSELRLAESERNCLWPFKDIQILWDGTVIPCVFDFDGKEILGDVNSSTIESVWLSKRYDAFRQPWREKKSFSIPLCAKCDEPDMVFQPRPVEQALQPGSRSIVPGRNRFSKKVDRSLHEIVREFRAGMKSAPRQTE